jgi:hypothetical protein
MNIIQKLSSLTSSVIWAILIMAMIWCNSCRIDTFSQKAIGYDDIDHCYKEHANRCKDPLKQFSGFKNFEI